MAIDGMAQSRFQDRFSGRVISPDNEEYNSARSPWNGAIDRRPALIARCGSTDDVVSALRFGREQDLEISVRGGGHSFAGHSVTDGGLMIDLSGMRSVEVDPGRAHASVDGGATWAELDGAAQAHGLAVTGGFISHTGVGGLTLGGGMGWLTPLFGLSIDNLRGATLVTADGRTLRASADENPDLFWAIRGGGGNFGIVTSFDFRLHEVGPMVTLALFFWGMDSAADGLRCARDIVAELPPRMGGFIGGLSAPPAPFVPEQHVGSPGFALLLVSFGADHAHADLSQRVRDTAPPTFEMSTPIPYAELQKMFDPNAPWGSQAYEKALLLDELSDDALAVMLDRMPRRSSPMSFTPLFVMGEGYRRVADDDTAFGGSRSAAYVYNIAGICPAPELYEPERAWAREFWEAMVPFSSNPAGYVNFIAEAADDRVRASYGPKYSRLAEIKAKYDPDNVFHLNANIAPPG